MDVTLPEGEPKNVIAEHPDIAVTEAFNFVDPVQEGYEGSMALLYEGAVLAIIVASYLMIVVDISIVITGLPRIQTSLGEMQAEHVLRIRMTALRGATEPTHGFFRVRFGARALVVHPGEREGRLVVAGFGAAVIARRRRIS